jgi:hypothetical protein
MDVFHDEGLPWHHADQGTISAPDFHRWPEIPDTCVGSKKNLHPFHVFCRAAL